MGQNGKSSIFPECLTPVAPFASMLLSMENKDKNAVVEEKKDPQIYEVGFHIVSSVAENDLGVQVTAIRDAIEAAGGMFIADEYPKYMELAYPMVKVASNKRATYKDSYFGWIKFEVAPKGILAVEKKLMANDNLLRFIIVKTVRENTMVPKKILQAKQRDENAPEEKVVVKPVMTEEELDKTIEDLVVS